MSYPPAGTRELRLALTCHALAGPRARDLLQGLAEPQRSRATELLARIAQMSGADRRSLLLSSFQPAPRSDRPFLRLLREAGPELRIELIRVAPRYWKLQAPDRNRNGPRPAVARGRVRFAARLIQEASS